jgi:hypothetical protein
MPRYSEHEADFGFVGDDCHLMINHLIYLCLQPQNHDLGIGFPNEATVSRTQEKVHDARARLRQVIIRTMAILLPHLASSGSGTGFSVSIVSLGIWKQDMADRARRQARACGK